MLGLGSRGDAPNMAGDITVHEGIEAGSDLDPHATASGAFATSKDDSKRRGVTWALVMLVTSILIISFLIVYWGPEWEFLDGLQPSIALRCELPTEQPYMMVPAMVPIEISNSTQAAEYASRWFPEFNGTEFQDDGGGTYSAEIDDLFLYVDSDGVLMYNHIGEMEEVPLNAFPETLARNISMTFINAHGGLGDYVEYDDSYGYSEDMKGVRRLTHRLFTYQRQYAGYYVFGRDWLGTMVTPKTQIVSSFHRAEFQLIETNETRQVISAETAWSALFNASGRDVSTVEITSVQLCYCVGEPFGEGVDVHAAWMFWGEGIDLYVDAFSGEVLTPPIFP